MSKGNKSFYVSSEIKHNLNLEPLYELGKMLVDQSNRNKKETKIGMNIEGDYILSNGNYKEDESNRDLIKLVEMIVSKSIENIESSSDFKVALMELSIFDKYDQDTDVFYTVIYGPDKASIKAYIKEMGNNMLQDQGRGVLLPNPSIYKSPFYIYNWNKNSSFSCKKSNWDSRTIYVGTFHPIFINGENDKNSYKRVCNYFKNFALSLAKNFPAGSAVVNTCALSTFSRPTPINDSISSGRKNRGGGLFLLGERKFPKKFNKFLLGLTLSDMMSRAILAMSHTATEHMREKDKEKDKQFHSFAHRTLKSIGSIRHDLMDDDIIEMVHPITQGTLHTLWQTVARYRKVPHDMSSVFPCPKGDVLKYYISISANLALQKARDDSVGRDIEINTTIPAKKYLSSPENINSFLEDLGLDIPIIPKSHISNLASMTFGIMLIHSLKQALYHAFVYRIASKNKSGKYIKLNMDTSGRRLQAVIRNKGWSVEDDVHVSDVEELEDMGCYFLAENVTGPKTEDGGNWWITSFEY